LEALSGFLRFGAVVLLPVSIMFLAAWAALSPRDVRPRLFVALVAALVVGLLPPYFSHGDLRDYGFYIAIAVGYAAILSASLSVFRACGYRLVRIDRPKLQPR